MRYTLPLASLALTLGLVACSDVGAVVEELPQNSPTFTESPPPEPPVVTRNVAGKPERLVVRGLGVNAPVLAVRAPNRVLTPPSDPAVMGWWADGARPGSGTGTVLIAGHTSSSSPAPLNDLETVEPGMKIRVATARDVLTYEVDKVRVFSKGRIFEEAETLFRQDGEERLALLTCEGWDGIKYNSNVVVLASRVK